MRLATTKQRLIDQCGFSKVAGAAAMAAAIQQQQFVSDAWLAVLEISAAKNDLVNAVSQLTTCKIGVARPLRVAGDQSGDLALDLVEDSRDLVIAALLNWRPYPEFDPFTYAGGRVVFFAPGVIVWSDEFVTSYLLRKTS